MYLNFCPSAVLLTACNVEREQVEIVHILFCATPPRVTQDSRISRQMLHLHCLRRCWMYMLFTRSIPPTQRSHEQNLPVDRHRGYTVKLSRSSRLRSGDRLCVSVLFHRDLLSIVLPQVATLIVHLRR
jgi:hypothetical protein